MASRVASPLADGCAQFREERVSRPKLLRSFNYRFGTKRQPLKRTAIKRESKGHKAEIAKYNASAASFFSEPGNSDCRICVRLREAGENIILRKATERHHFRGRTGRLLNWRPGWIPSCFHHRLWPHQHPTRARQLGLLAPAHLYDVFPDDGKK